MINDRVEVQQNNEDRTDRKENKLKQIEQSSNDGVKKHMMPKKSLQSKRPFSSSFFFSFFSNYMHKTHNFMFYDL